MLRRRLINAFFSEASQVPLGFKKGSEFYSVKSNTPEEEMFGKGWPED